MLNEWSDRVPNRDPKKKRTVLWVLFALALLVVFVVNLR
jgi:hypothetical protein